MIHNIQSDYFQSTLPDYLEKVLSQSVNQQGQKIPNLSQLQTKLFLICYKGLSRQRYIEIILREFIKYRQKIVQILQKDENNQNKLKKYIKIQLFIWKLHDQMKRKQKYIKQSEVFNKQNQRQKNHLQIFIKYFQKLYKHTLNKNQNSFSSFLIQTFHQISDSERIPRRFKERIIQILFNSGIQHIDKYMKILGQQANGKTTPEGYQTPANQYLKKRQQKTGQKSQFIYSGKKSSGSNQAYYSAPIPDSNKHKKIYKQSKVTPIRTIYISHPIHHRIYREKPKKQMQKQQQNINKEDIKLQN